MNSRFRRIETYDHLKADINVTPFVDVILVLLIIFMLSTPLLVSQTTINLPQATAKSVDSDEKSVELSIDKDNNIKINDNQIANYEQLVSCLKNLIYAKNISAQDLTIFLRADKNLEYQEVVKILAILQKNDFTKLSLISVNE